jgi:hypothetical protein
VVTVMAMIIYFVSLGVYTYSPLPLSTNSLKKLVILLCTQILLTTAFYICLK